VKPDFMWRTSHLCPRRQHPGQIINLMLDLQDRFGLTYLFIAHDLAVSGTSPIGLSYSISQVMEIAPAGAIFQQPLHPYTRT